MVQENYLWNCMQGLEENLSEKESGVAERRHVDEINLAKMELAEKI